MLTDFQNSFFFSCKFPVSCLLKTLPCLERVITLPCDMYS